MAPPAPIDRATGRAAIQKMRVELGAVATPAGRSAQSGPVLDEVSRLRRRVDHLEQLLTRQRERAADYEVALAEIATLTRGLTGDKTARVHEIASVALHLEVSAPAAPRDEEPFE